MKRLSLLLLIFLGTCFGTQAQSIVNNSEITITNGTILTVPGNVTNNGTINNNGDISLGGEWLNNSTYNAGVGSLTLNSTADQIVNHNAQSFSRLRVTGGGTKVFDADLTIENELILEDGVLRSGNNAVLTIAENATLDVMGTQSYIEGRVIHEGTGNKLFPVGANGQYLPISLLDVSGTNLSTSVEVLEPNPLSTVDNTLGSVSSQRYWDVQLESGDLTNVVYEVKLLNEIIGDLPDLVVALSEDQQIFSSIGQEQAFGAVSDGFISSIQQSTTGYITIGSVGEAPPADGIVVYNAITPNGDGIHDFLEIGNIESYSNNEVVIYDRWGSRVYSVKGYNNTSIVFEGIGNLGTTGELPNGTYYYLINKGDGSKSESGSLLLKR